MYPYQFAEDGGGSMWGELAATTVNLDYDEQVTTVQFDGLQEVVWAGTDAGRINTFLAPHLEPYAYWPAHSGSVQGILPLPGTDCALTVGRDKATLCTNGGLQRAGIKAGLEESSKQASFGGCCFEPLPRGRGVPQAAVMGLLSGGLLHWDLSTSKVLVMNKECLGTEGIAHLCGPAGRGDNLLAAGLTSGRLLLLDCRTPRSLKLEPGAGGIGVAAHIGGFSAMDARGDYVACCGYSMRGSYKQPDAYMKVFDVRNLGGSTLKPLLTLPFPHLTGAPRCLSFHPMMHSLLLVGSGRGSLDMVDITRGAPTSTNQVTMDGSSLNSVCVSPTGEAWLLGDATSCVRLWSESDTPSCHSVPNYTEVPPTYVEPSFELQEEDSFALAPQYPLEYGSAYLNECEPDATMSIGLPPRIVDPTIMKKVRQVDFVGHHPNPYFVRGKPFGVATAAVATLRNTRVPMFSIKLPPAASIKREKKRRAGPILPHKFKRVEIRAQAGLKFEEFNFASYNSTRFAGLENDLPNSYANALLQVLYFTPGLRTALLTHVPEPDSEFCLTCELGLLFRCMAASHGKPCQASNLLRALRQIREAAALGLLDSSLTRISSGPNGGQANEANSLGNRWALGRRVAALARFLSDHCYKEASTQAHSQGSLHNRSGITPQPVPANAALRPLLERLVGLPHTVRLKCLGGNKEEKTREGRVFQVDLQYPMEREKAARLAADAAHLGFNKIPEAAVAVLRSAPPPAPAPHSKQADATTQQQHVPGRQQQSEQQQDQTSSEGQPDQQQSKEQLSKQAQQGTSQVHRPEHNPQAQAPVASTTTTKPSFSDLLRQSLLGVSETRAWFSESRGYALVRQSRVPTALPQMLVIDCSVKNPSDISWWLPDPLASTSTQAPPAPQPSISPPPTLTASRAQSTAAAAAAGASAAESSSAISSDKAGSSWKQEGGGAQGVQAGEGRQQVDEQQKDGQQEALCQDVHEARSGAGQLPWALRVEVMTEQQDLHVVQGASAELLGKGEGNSSLCATYELSAMICQIQDADEEEAEATSTSERQAAAAAAAAHAAARGSLVAAEVIGSEGHLVSLIRVPHRYWDEAPLRSCLTQPPLGAMSTVHPTPNTTFASKRRSANLAALELAASSRLMSPTTSINLDGVQGSQDEPRPETAGTKRGMFSPATPAPGEGWLLFNDFSIGAVDRSEIMASYGAQKLPCLVYYTRIDPPVEDDGSPLSTQVTTSDPVAADSAAGSGKAKAGKSKASKAAAEGKAAEAAKAAAATDCEPSPEYPLPPPPVPPVLTRQQFKQLCQSPPLQGPQPPNTFKFVPLDTSPNSKEAPRPGLLLALDAEFVMVQPPGRVLKRSTEVLTRNCRLGLARVSILRGEGPRLGVPCIDDYVRAVEPVFDHLTRYSGLVPGDLEPSTTCRYLTTMKHAYLKLRYLVDCGCVFVGHGFSKDFRMINIYVPPEQLVDTVELFSFKRKRKLSLRFLASYMLGINIQANVHDSVEDARTALRLYLKYRELVEEGTFQEKLEELYNWGKQYGWEPVVLGKDGKLVPPSAPVMISL